MQPSNRRRSSIGAIVLGAVLALGAGHGPAAAASSIRAVVNGEAITSNEVGVRSRILQLTSHATGASADRAALEDLIDDRLKLQEAKRTGTDVSEAQVEAAFASIAARLKITPAMLAQGLAQRGIDAKALKARIKVQIIWQQLVVGRFSRSVSISDSQIVDALAKKEGGNREAATKSTGSGTTTEYTLQQVVLVVAAKGGSPEARMREAEALRAKATTCESLIELVKPLNEAMVKQAGRRTDDELPANFQGLLADVPVGHLSKPVRTAIGIEMLAVCGKRDLAGNFQVRSKVEDELRNQEGELFARRYINDLRRIAVIDYKK
ncbi:peptidylprolyl isomerase [Siculibacillus lacustris]|uniref:Peptidylprolyl isomerase n=1 Tax=Siculibacillus lacustris TaxID=1549641 RepID=A0A4Q9VUC3_9HYPH|nr:SurA N-terminal domain-containing protein [Siculibacillus lacustris]TBW39772.1 peptidylprolyl isomerase [Siculibacillus lacustris]